MIELIKYVCYILNWYFLVIRVLGNLIYKIVVFLYCVKYLWLKLCVVIKI